MKNNLLCLIILLIFSLNYSEQYENVALRNKQKERIFGGVNSRPHQFPYTLSLKYFDSITGWIGHNCGGTILTSEWIISAAHCFYFVNPGYYEVWAGKHNLSVAEIYAQVREIKYTILHPDYNPIIVGPHDIALSKLEYPFKLTPTVQTINLPAQNSIPFGNATFAGWGAISNTSEIIMPDILQMMTVPILTHQTCANILNETYLDRVNFCTGPLDGSKTTCNGDAGSALIQENKNGTPILVGVMSFGYFPCGRENRPTVFCRISHYIDWIYYVLDNK